MKTFLACQPLIYSALFAEPERRGARPRQTLRIAAVALLICYFAASMKIMADTGFAAWNWQFWIMFTPVFMLGEQLLRTLDRKPPVSRGTQPTA